MFEQFHQRSPVQKQNKKLNIRIAFAVLTGKLWHCCRLLTVFSTAVTIKVHNYQKV